MQKRCISRDWLLAAPGMDGKKAVHLPNDYTVTLPRDKDAAGGASNGFFPGGDGTYEKTLTIGSKAHRILWIDGGYMCTEISLNGEKLAEHPHGYTPFLVELTEGLTEGDNLLSITTHGNQCSTRWYAGAGLYRDVFLWEGGDIRMEPWDVFISTPTLDSVHAAYEITADRAAAVVLRCEILDKAGTVVAVKTTPVNVFTEGKTAVAVDFTLPNARAWDIGDPYLYSMRSTILENGAVLDTDVSRFGIRTVTADAVNGLQINGKTVKLRGGCIHHDHAILGAADVETACRRKLTKLQEAGFNALRIAHNPPSEQLMNMCDEMGIIVMDEAFDCWHRHKGGSENYHKYFDEWWERDIAYMVKRDRRHPCVIAFSTGNEIPESVGCPEGDALSALLSAKIRALDPTRLVTSCTYQMAGEQPWEYRTEKYFEPCDICGYNYLYPRYEHDHKLFPNRVIWGSETHAIHFYDSWNTVLRLPYAIGDFTWTAYDNLGEAGTGRYAWERDEVIKGISLAAYPWRSCYQGDIDLCGYRRPQSYFREAVWIGGCEPKIFTTHPAHYGEGFSGTGWHWYDVLDSWTFDDAYIGKPVKCEVYTDADEIEWFVNGVSVGKSAPVKAIATMDIPYEKGEISVIAYKNGEKVGCSSLHTVGAAAALTLTPETGSLKADGQDLCYVDISLTDGAGDRIPDDRRQITCTVEGGCLIGVYSADPANEDQYGSDTCHLYEGRAVAVIKADAAGDVKITVTADGVAAGCAVVVAK